MSSIILEGRDIVRDYHVPGGLFSPARTVHAVKGVSFKVEKGRTYHMKIERKGDTISAWVDGQLLASMVDEDPLWGPGHDHFAINNWQSELWFDNLKITPL